MTERGVSRRPDPATSRPLTLAALGIAVLCALAGAAAVDPLAAQPRFDTPLDSVRWADSVAAADSQRVRDSTWVADSLAMEEEAQQEEFAGAFGGATSILDRSRRPGLFLYNTSYSINRSNRSWSQSADLRAESKRLQVANVTTVAINRETKVQRLNRNRQTRTELAYRLAPWLRLGGNFGLQRNSDEARTNFTPVLQDNDDLTGTVRINHSFGIQPVRLLGSYGYLKNQQFQQQSEGRTFSLYGSTSRNFGNTAAFTLDGSQLVSQLTSTVPEDPGYNETDRNTNRDLSLTANLKPLRWVSADTRLSTQRSVVRRPARVQSDPLDPLSDLIVVPERINGTTDQADGSLSFNMLGGTALKLSGGLSKNEQVYNAEADRSSVANRTSFTSDVTRTLLKTRLSLTYENTTTENDYTRRDPGYVENALQRRLEGTASRPLGPRVSARLSSGIFLTRRRYFDFRSSLGGIPPSNQDQRRVRGNLNLTYRPGTRFDTGVTLGLEQNDLVNVARTSSINNARLRTYSVAWQWNARPGTIWSVTQNNSATAAQQFYTFTSDRDQVSFIYNITTVLTSQLTQRVRLDLTHVMRLQSRGSFRLVESTRRYGKSSEFNTFDLTLRSVYTASDWLTLEAQERLSASPNFTVVAGNTAKVSETRRTEFTGTARFNYPFSGSASLNGDVRRILATDRNRTFGSAPTDQANNNDYWFGTISFRMDF